VLSLDLENREDAPRVRGLVAGADGLIEGFGRADTLG
jgi:crotonobetainyl-CoA:carnitine CoA-transferase CaiB-like acyl-CoA transferase